MTLKIEPVPGGTMPDPIRGTEREKYAQMLSAAEKTAELLAEYNLDVSITDEALQAAGETLFEYARDPVTTTKKMSAPTALARMTPTTLLATKKVLEEYGHSVVQDALQIRHMVTNKLIEETENPDPRIRLKALELLGKHSDVGLFSEKSEVTITHQTSDDLREKLRTKLTNMIDITPGVSDVREEVLDGEERAGDEGGTGMDVQQSAAVPEPAEGEDPEDEDPEDDFDFEDLPDADELDWEEDEEE